MNRDSPSEPIRSIAGHWITLEPVGPSNLEEVRALYPARELYPAMGGAQERPENVPSFAPAMAVRMNANGAVVGLLESGVLTGYPGVAVLVVYMDTARARAGLVVEAWIYYVELLFRYGARLVHLEVMEFNDPILRPFRRAGLVPQARLREHAFVAGKFWDMLLFSFDRGTWLRWSAQFARLFAGGDRRPAVLGTRRPAP